MILGMRVWVCDGYVIISMGVLVSEYGYVIMVM